MHKPDSRNLLFAGFVVFSVRMAFTSTAAADPTSEIVTKRKGGIVETPGTRSLSWSPSCSFASPCPPWASTGSAATTKRAPDAGSPAPGCGAALARFVALSFRSL